MRKTKTDWFGGTIFAVVLALVVFTLLASGCKSTLDPAGAYSGDNVLYQADQTIATTYDVIDTFLAWERTNQAGLPPDLHAFAENLRKEAPGWFGAATRLRTAYVAEPTPENRTKLANALGVLRAALNEATRYMIAHKARKLSTVDRPLFLIHRIAA